MIGGADDFSVACGFSSSTVLALRRCAAQAGRQKKKRKRNRRAGTQGEREAKTLSATPARRDAETAPQTAAPAIVGNARDRWYLIWMASEK